MPSRMVTARDLGVELDEFLHVQLPEVWLRADERARELALRIDSARTRRRIARCLEEEVIALDQMQGLAFSGWVRPHGEGEILTVEFRSACESGECEDVFRFDLEFAPETLLYSVQSRRKLVRDVWGGGCVPGRLRSELMGAVIASKKVAQHAGRFGREIAAEDVSWDWVPVWDLPQVALPDGRGTAEDALREASPAGELPEYGVLATWSLAVEERPASSGGVRVKLLIDPFRAALAGDWDEEWCALY